MTVQHELDVDVVRQRTQIVHVVQDDSTRELRLNVYNDGEPFDILGNETETVVGIVAFRKPDGHRGEYDTMSDGVTSAVEYIADTEYTWLVRLEGQVTACAGKTLLTVKFYTESGRLIQAFPLTLYVAPSATPLNEPSEDYHNVQSLADIIAAVSDLQDTVDSLVIDVGGLHSPVIWYTAAIPVSSQIGRILPKTNLVGPVGANPAPGDMVVSGGDYYAYFISADADQVVVVQDDRILIKGADGSDGTDGADGTNAIIWYTTSRPTGAGINTYIALDALQGPVGAVPAAGHMIVSNYQNTVTGYFISSVAELVAYIQDYYVPLGGST